MVEGGTPVVYVGRRRKHTITRETTHTVMQREVRRLTRALTSYTRTLRATQYTDAYLHMRRKKEEKKKTL